MPLFQKSVIAKYLKTQDKTILSNQWTDFKNHFHNPTIQENIRNSKEEQYQEGFLRDLFVKILGYSLNPDANFNLTTEYKNVKDSKKADGAIIIEEKVRAVIELKGTNTTDLGKIETQAFGYKNNQPDCTYIVTSNFEKIRFYIDNAIEHIEFNLFTLTEADFDLLYLCLGFDNIAKNIAKKIKDESLSEEDVITKKLYKDYSLFKRELHQNLVALNPDYEPLELFKKSQKLLDRFLFLFFGEDRHLLPPNSVRLILAQWNQLRELDEYTPLYDRFKKYFGYLNTGYKGKQYDVFAYNGGLFKSDEILDGIIIDDDLLYNHTLKLSEYDFASEVDVNILGHIFENSLNELDEIKAQLEGQEVDKTKTKRKKDGVFYTPKYITKYIVENTIGKLCEEKKAEVNIIEEDYFTDKKRTNKTKQPLLEKLTNYRNWLLQLTICDPACGSGAFLNQALDFLIEEHRYIDELQAKLFGDAMVLSDVEKSILENNLFGVDLNEESVEIAKLSLWLRTAQPNRKLNDLNNNIKCGNSLIDNVEVTGDKAFNWQTAFPQVFVNGGFDVIIGNPPYVFARDNFKQEEKDFFVKQYVSAKYQINTYLLFIEKTVHLLKEKGIYGLIIPNSWLMMYSGEGLRKFLLETNKLNQIINLAGYSFESANVETVILLAEKAPIKNENSIQILLNNGNEFYFSHSKQQTEFANNEGFEFKVFLDDESEVFNTKIVVNTFPLNDLVEIKAGLKAYEKDKGEPKQSAEDVINRIYDYDYKFDKDTYKYLEGKDVGRYFTNWAGSYLKYGKQLAAPRTFNLFDGKKIIVREITGNFPKCLIATYSEDVYLFNMSNIAIIEKANSEISLKYIVAVLNSKLLSYYFVKNTAKSVRKLFPKIILNDLRKFPINKISLIEQQPFIEKADLMSSLNKSIQELSQKFQRTLEREFALQELPKKLQDWYSLSYGDFIKELAKKKVILTLSQKAEWEDYFIQEQKKAIALKTQIDKTDKEIDGMVYELYGLTEEGIGIVEGLN
ncbi:N-6 DNA methylase [Flavobacterium franklandianum]|uniref:Eco57I restriction-modification methylase domain-containing protein n=1 Tax=Flavobacterium franklandianum TaxID=2594430 RepID=UPI00117B4153|nr:TaqI-like C-terminal specificity domain-containing protein [Flavobacterium franklandianum]TRX26704.1 N-6 DNA methylase [Flavobacterium franklandianum]